MIPLEQLLMLLQFARLVSAALYGSEVGPVGCILPSSLWVTKVEGANNRTHC
jgi:hypothetical protein